MNSSGIKCCSSCGQYKPTSEFYKCKGCTDGLRGECKACVSAKQKKYNAEHAEEISAHKRKRYQEADAVERARKMAAYYRENSEVMKKRAKDWEIANKAYVKQRKAKYWQDNRQSLLASKARYKSENAEIIRTRRAAWYAEHKERLRPQRKILKALRRGAGRLSRGIVERLMTMQRSKCACCHTSLADGYHLDHITPLAKGGTNADHNMQLLCPRCNLSKSAKDPIEFMQSRGFLI